MEIRVIKDFITKEDLAEIAEKQFGEFIKAVVDIEKKVMAVGGELHADEEAVLLEQGSEQKNLWGINIYHEKPEHTWIEYTSMINIRPSQGNRSREVEEPNLKENIKKIVNTLVT